MSTVRALQIQESWYVMCLCMVCCIGGEKGIPLCLQLDTYSVSGVEGSGGEAKAREEKLIERWSTYMVTQIQL